MVDAPALPVQQQLYPPPPPFYKLYRDDADGSAEIPLPPEPPALVEGTYAMFGELYSVSTRVCDGRLVGARCPGHQRGALSHVRLPPRRRSTGCRLCKSGRCSRPALTAPQVGTRAKRPRQHTVPSRQHQRTERPAPRAAVALTGSHCHRPRPLTHCVRPTDHARAMLRCPLPCRLPWPDAAAAQGAGSGFPRAPRCARRPPVGLRPPGKRQLCSSTLQVYLIGGGGPTVCRASSRERAEGSREAQRPPGSRRHGGLAWA